MPININSQSSGLIKSLFDPDFRLKEDAPLGARERVALQSQDSFAQAAPVSKSRVVDMVYAYQYSETFNIQVTTQEGDTVSIDFRQMYFEYQAARSEQQKMNASGGVRYFENTALMEASSFEESLAFSVNGELNEEELNAIFDLFEQVDTLANSFFNGNIEKALEQAITLEVDFETLQGFQLNLTQVESQSVAYQYEALAEYDSVQGVNNDETSVKLFELPSYFEQWQAVIEGLESQFAESQKVFEMLMSDVIAQRFPEQGERSQWLERLERFHDVLLEYVLQGSQSLDTNVLDSNDSLYLEE